MRKCANCGNMVQDDAIFCDQCGTRLPVAAVPAGASADVTQPAAVEPVAPLAPVAPVAPVAAVAPVAPVEAAPVEAICPSCGTHNLPGEAFCQNCGTKLEAPQPVAVPATAAPVAPVAVSPTICPDCGATVGPSEEFCFACGADLKAARARASQGVAPVAAAPAVPVVPVLTAPAEPTALPVTQEPVAPAVPATVTSNCPTCGAEVKEGDAFCEACGAALTPAAPSATADQTVAPAQPAAATAVAPVTAARLVVVSSGVELPLAGRSEVVVGREDPYSGVFPDIDLTPHGGVEGGVSRRHFKITSVSGQYMIEDLNSTNFTMVNRNRLQPGTQKALADGDEVTAGRVKLVFKVSA